MRLTVLPALALATALLAPLPVLAQSDSDGPPYGPGMMWDDDGGWGPGMMGRGGGYGMMRGCPMMGGAMMRGGDFQRSASAWIEGQLAYAHTELGITAEQEPLWKGYADAVRARSAEMLETHRTMMQTMWQRDAPLDQVYDLHISVMESHLATMKANRDTVMKLYKALTPEQQEKASWVLPRAMCMM